MWCAYKYTQSTTQTHTHRYLYTDTYTYTGSVRIANIVSTPAQIIFTNSMAVSSSSSAASDHNNSQVETKQQPTNPGGRVISGNLYESDKRKTCHQVL